MRYTIPILLAAWATAGCDAIYEDLRPFEARPMPADDGGPPPDAGPPVADDDGGAPGTVEVLARGPLEGRTGYFASGTVALERDPDGSLHLRFEDDFDSQAVPGPVVVLSPRPELGSAIDPAAGDRQLGVLERPSGSQRYAAPPETADARYAWIYCLPFGVEVARAPLTPPEAP